MNSWLHKELQMPQKVYKDIPNVAFQMILFLLLFTHSVLPPFLYPAIYTSYMLNCMKCLFYITVVPLKRVNCGLVLWSLLLSVKSKETYSQKHPPLLQNKAY